MVINQQYLNCRLVQRFCDRDRLCRKCSVEICKNCPDYTEVPAPGWEWIPDLTDEQVKAKDWASL